MLQRMSLWIISIRDSFITLLPLTFLGVIAILVRDFPLVGYQYLMGLWWGAGWHKSVDVLINATHGLFGLTLSVLVAVHLSRRLCQRYADTAPIPSIFVALSAMTNFMVFVITFSPLAFTVLGHNATFLGLVVGVASAEFIQRLFRSRLVTSLKLPYDTDIVFFHALRVSLPVIVAGLATFVFALMLSSLRAGFGDGEGAGSYLLDGVSFNAWTGLLSAALINHVVWFVGVHGGYVLDTFFSGVLFLPAGADYASSLAWRPMFDSFVLLGGTGATLGLLVAIHIAVKEGFIKRVGQLSLLPGLFNINETLLYGLPIVLNRTFLVPFIVLPILLSLMTLGAVHNGWLTLHQANIPWTTPPLISGWLLTGSWHGVAFQFLELVVSTLVYLPYVRAAEVDRVQRQQLALGETIDAVMRMGRTYQAVCARTDGVGLFARGLLDDFRNSLDKGELTLAYQPKHRSDGRIMGFEALLRWQHTKYGPLSPAVGVALAEESGDIHKLGAWVIREACACKARWNKQGDNVQLTMAINVSPIQLSDPLLVETVRHALTKYKLSPQEIELEVTETRGVPDAVVELETLQALSELGIHLAIDDFGMGYSSLLYLKRFHVDSIKIDGSLTQDILTNPTSLDIVKAVVSLGQTRHVNIVAEYVETIEQRDLLANLGCHCFQGYLFSKPLNEGDAYVYAARAQSESVAESHG